MKNHLNKINKNEILLSYDSTCDAKAIVKLWRFKEITNAGEYCDNF